MGCSESKHNHPYGCDTEKQDVPVRDKDKKKVIVSTFELIFFLAPIETLTQQLRFRKLSPYINSNKFQHVMVITKGQSVSFKFKKKLAIQLSVGILTGDYIVGWRWEINVNFIQFNFSNPFALQIKIDVKMCFCSTHLCNHPEGELFSSGEATLVPNISVVIFTSVLLELLMLKSSRSIP